MSGKIINDLPKDIASGIYMELVQALPSKKNSRASHGVGEGVVTGVGVRTGFGVSNGVGLGVGFRVIFLAPFTDFEAGLSDFDLGLPNADSMDENRLPPSG